VAQALLRRTLFLIASSTALVAAAARAEASGPCASMPTTVRVAASDTRRSDRDTLKIASLNMAAQPRIRDALVLWTTDRQFDVVLLQEVGDRSMDGGAFVAEVGDRLGYHVAYAPANLFGDTETQGLAILSRHPLSDVRVIPLEYHRLRFKSRCRIGLAVTVATPTGPVRVVNVHLDTRINSKERLAQLEPLVRALALADGPRIIGGDFNTMDIRWWRTMWPFPLVEHQAAAVRTHLKEHGFQTPFPDGQPTLKFLGLPIQLDWLYLKELDALDWSVDDVPFSDHRGVWTRVRLRPR